MIYRTHNCGELALKNKSERVILSGWVSKIRDLGSMSFVDLRDRYGITQLVLSDKLNSGIKIGREYVLRVEGEVKERLNKNPKIYTGEIEIEIDNIEILSISELPPFTIEDETDGGEELRMKYRYLDLRRKPLQENIILRSKVNSLVRKYLTNNGFLDIETPFLIKSTPEGARDFVVPSRMNENKFYALPQSPQTFKQLLMVSGFDRYFQIVKCFRDEDLRADRQPEFTQIDCEMSFVNQNDIMEMFGGMIKYLLKEVKGIIIDKIPVITYKEAIDKYGTDKPDIRFDMHIENLSDLMKGKGFQVFDNEEYVAGINVKKCNYTRKDIDEITEWIKRPQIGAKGLVWIKFNKDGTIKSSVDKFYNTQDLEKIKKRFNADIDDIVLVVCGDELITKKILGALRLELAKRLKLRNPNEYGLLWVIDFPMFDWDKETGRYYAMHHPFTSPKSGDIEYMDKDLSKVLANAYDIVLNGNEIGGGSIRIFDQELQKKVFSILGFTEKEIENQFGFLINAFKYGVPPHGGIAVGFDRIVALLGGEETIRDFIAFPKNNSGIDVMIDSPSFISEEQLKELNIKLL